MLVEANRKEIFRSKCQSTVESLHCFGHLDQDIREVLPYLNAVLGGFEYTVDPPPVTFKAHGKLIAVHPRKIAINALRDEEEADKIMEWLEGDEMSTRHGRGVRRSSRAMKGDPDRGASRASSSCRRPTAGKATRRRAWSLPRVLPRGQEMQRMVPPLRPKT